MATRLLIIHKQLVFAVTLKQALEQTGGFAVHPFTKAEAAFDFLRDHPQDIALVDLNLPGRSGTRIIQQLRLLQPDIAIIVTPQLSAADMRGFGVQASLNSPFTARELLPLLQNVLDEAPSDNLGTAPPTQFGGNMTTSNLGDQKRIKQQQMGTTQNLGNNSLLSSDEPAQTNILNPAPQDPVEKPQTKPLVDNPLKPPPPEAPRQRQDSQPNRPTTRPFIDNPPPVQPPAGKSDPFGTRQLDDLDLNDLRPPKTKPFVEQEPPAAPNIDRFQTRNLQDDADSEPKSDTRILPEPPPIPEIDSLQTRRLDADEPVQDDGPQTRNLGGQQPNFDPYGTRPLGEAEPPPAPPEFSSLDRVLQSFGMEEPPADEMDTPAVPTKDSDALRQFIATNSGQFDAESFDDVLGAIEPDITEPPKKQRQVDFEGLVKSMQRDEPQRRLPDRQQQQLLDFVLTTGMDSVLKEIEKTKTGTLPKIQPPPEPPKPLPKPPKAEGSFQKLAEEEPPLPTLEENGTVSDLLVGISDSNFRDVLALLNESGGDTPAPPPPSSKQPITPAQQVDPSDTGYFEDFLRSTSTDSESVPVNYPPRAMGNYDYTFDFSDEEDGESVASVVLSSTQQNTANPGEFSLDQLMSDINNRLTTHKLKIRPLPSWDMDTTAFHAPVTDDTPKARPTSTPKRMMNEPSFLPEMFPPDDIIPPELPPLEASEVWTTRASEPSLEQIESVEPDGETMVELGYFDETTDETVMGEAAPAIDADLFSGILDESAADDEAPRYDDTAESSGNQFAFDWNEPDNTVEAAPVEETFGEPQAETLDDTLTPDQWDTIEARPESESGTQEFGTWTAEETAAPQEAVTDNWDTDWAPSEPAPETTADTVADAWDLPSETTQDDIPPVETHAAALSEEARIAQLALNLTQVSLELSAEGTILTRDNQIIALAGHLSQEDVIELQNVIHNDWGTSGDGARLRFITLPSSNKEYMLYSTGTEDSLILSMIFAGSTPLRVIRQQGQRLIKALGNIPEPAPAAAITSAPRREVQPIELALEPYAYVWLVRDPEQPLSNAVAQSITAGLTTQLNEMHWQIEQLQVQDEYIYLYAQVPSETPSYTIIKELKQRAATIAGKQDSNLEPQALWADSYLVLSPGRELAPDEIQEFLDFQRMM